MQVEQLEVGRAYEWYENTINGPTLFQAYYTGEITKVPEEVKVESDWYGFDMCDCSGYRWMDAEDLRVYNVRLSRTISRDYRYILDRTGGDMDAVAKAMEEDEFKGLK